MAIGMTYEQYWFGDPLMVRAFYKADRLRRERADEDAWLHGLYMVAALNATVGNIGNRGKLNEYPGEPIMLSEKKERKRLKEEQRKEQEAVWAMAWMSSFVEAGKNWGKKG